MDGKKNNPKNILVTGGAGFIGSNLVMALQEKFPEAKITVVDNFFSGHLDNLKDFKGRILEKDIVTLNLDKYFPELDVIFHQAAISDTIFKDYQRVFFENIEGFRNVLRYALVHEADLIYASSSAVYGNSHPPMRVGSGEFPQSVYGASKLITDEIARNYFGRTKKKLVGLRYFIVYGPREARKITKTRGSIIYKLYSQMKKGKRPILLGNGDQKRDFVYVKDVVGANLLALETKRNGIFNVGVGKAITFDEVVSVLNKVLGKNLKPIYKKNPIKTYQYFSQADLKDTKAALGYYPSYTLWQGIRDYLI